ncbi:MAG: hypothetical protein HGA40_05495 [Methanoregulaceae archaeon]|nr:hypothetical protein [Methanoregulaceae archaeon]
MSAGVLENRGKTGAIRYISGIPERRLQAEKVCVFCRVCRQSLTMAQKKGFA